MSYIYLASPYTHQDPKVEHARFLHAETATARLLRHRQWVYSPIVHCHELARRHELPTHYEFWATYNRAMLQHASELRILKLPGWDQSKGVSYETQLARSIGIPVTYEEP